MSNDILKKIVDSITYFQNNVIEIGILGTGGNISSNGKIQDEITVLEYGTYLEFGTSKMQPFGFIRNAINSNQDEINNKIEEITNDILSGNLTGKEASMQLGEFIRGLVVESIVTAGRWARPLSPNYEKSKLKKYPGRVGQTLIREGFLERSIRYKIKRGTIDIHISDWAKI